MTIQRLVAACIVIAALPFGAVLPASAGAQTVRGSVEDSLGVPLSDVRVSILRASSDSVVREARSGNRGEFAITLEDAGRYRVRLNRIGFAQQTTAAMDLLANQILTLKLTMHTVARQLAPVTIVERRNVTLSELMSASGFDIRQAKFPMRAMNAEQFEQEGHTTLEELFRSGRFFGVQVNDGELGGLLAMRAPPPPPPSGYCNAEVFLDGMLLNDTSSSASEIALIRVGSLTTDMLYGVEVYRGNQLPSAGLAGELGTSNLVGSSIKPCGAVAVWTKYGRERSLIAERAKKGEVSQVVRGTLVDFTTGRPIPNGTAILLSEYGAVLEKQVLADSNGIFLFRTAQYGRLRLDVSAGGYVQLQTPAFQIDPDELLTLDVILAPAHRPLAPVAIRRREVPGKYAATDFRGFGFRQRRASGGIFFDSAGIARSNSATLGQLIRGVPGVQLFAAGDSIGMSLATPPTRGHVAPTSCSPMYFLNGELQRAPGISLGGVSLSEARGVEVFPVASELPYVFRMGSTGCGVVVVWTK